jgi:hypothetical protein
MDKENFLNEMIYAIPRINRTNITKNQIELMFAITGLDLEDAALNEEVAMSIFFDEGNEFNQIAAAEYRTQKDRSLALANFTQSRLHILREKQLFEDVDDKTLKEKISRTYQQFGRSVTSVFSDAESLLLKMNNLRNS